ncbi:hypothetical protein CC86DRAFT_468095 [Ophiobolus disseminans]|uniref:MYND-type domain-containing protein n=1 Tax=Ophiobolus disseminans TaxID=1469910 RepID=A0A6A6ZUP9_9PLEO|nr:hypothetical protein CC86DRAFT_468095 [Ophiobolus disseminans]
MGAWRLGLFQSDHDLNIIWSLDNESRMLLNDFVVRGLQKSAMVIPNRRNQTDMSDSDKNLLIAIESLVAGLGSSIANDETTLYTYGSDEDADEAFIRTDFHHSVYANHCTRPGHVCRLLEQEPNLVTNGPSAVTQLIQKYTDEMHTEQRLSNPYGAAYTLVILGAYFMIGLQRDALAQMQQALYGLPGYHNGTPYNFGSMDCQDAQQAGGAAKADRPFPGSGLMNVRALNDAAPVDVLESLDDDLKKRLATEQATMKALALQPQSNCMVCDATSTHTGSALHTCAKCKRVLYCGMVCQKEDWKVHKQFCSMLATPNRKVASMYIGNRDPIMCSAGFKDRLVAPSPAKLEAIKRVDPTMAENMVAAQKELEAGPKRDDRDMKIIKKIN